MSTPNDNLIERATAALHNAGKHDVANELYELHSARAARPASQPQDAGRMSEVAHFMPIRRTYGKWRAVVNSQLLESATKAGLRSQIQRNLQALQSTNATPRACAHKASQ